MEMILFGLFVLAIGWPQGFKRLIQAGLVGIVGVLVAAWWVQHVHP